MIYCVDDGVKEQVKKSYRDIVILIICFTTTTIGRGYTACFTSFVVKVYTDANWAVTEDKSEIQRVSVYMIIVMNIREGGIVLFFIFTALLFLSLVSFTNLSSLIM